MCEVPLFTAKRWPPYCGGSYDADILVGNIVDETHAARCQIAQNEVQ